MKQLTRRGMSLMLALILVFSLVPGLTVPANAADYVANWGRRGVHATSLSSYATAFYAGNGVTYEDLALLEGSSDVAAVPASALYARLQGLMTANHSHITTYDETKDMFRYTDCQEGGDTISSFYSGIAIGPQWDSGSTWNREHTWPNSKGLEGDDENDIMMLRPTSTSGQENSSRGNKAYGLSSGFYDPNTESGGALNLHGDVARIALYVYVRWANTGKMWGADGVIESKDLLLNWILEDPVDTWELGRNDSVQSITGTRNVFVDYPELAFLLLGEAVPSTMITPSGKAGEGYAITATVNDEAMGSVSLSGNNINALPAEGYLVEGYEVISGDATVTRNGNAFTVSALSDCTIQINFAPKAVVTLSYFSNGILLSEQTAYSGDSIVLPAFEGTAPEGYSFLGWTDTAVLHSDTLPEYNSVGESYTLSADTQIHALFSYETTGESSVWSLVTDANALYTGAKVIVAAAGADVALSTTQNNNNRGQAAITKNADNTVLLTDDVARLTLGEGTKAGTWSLSPSDGGYLYAASGSKNYLRTQTTLNDNGSWLISVDASGIATLKAQGTNSRNWMRYNSSNSLFSCYSQGQQDICLYMEGTAASKTVYTTASCLHENTTQVPGLSATCTDDGYTDGVFCSDCESYISGHVLLPAPGHSYASQVTPPTATEDGFTTYTCGACGHSYVDNIVPALGETYTVSFSVPQDAAAIGDMSCNNSGITLPAAEVPAPEQETYSFLGWTTESVDSTTEMPAYLEAGTHYVAPGNITLYALYSRTQGGTGEVSYVLVTDPAQLKSGAKVVITALDFDAALSTEQRGNNRGKTDITKNADNTITLNPSVAQLVLGAGTKEDTWSFYCAANNGYLYAASSKSNHLKTQQTLDDNASFTIGITAGGEATIKAQGANTRNLLRFNSTNDPQLFSCYGSGQKPVSLYVETVDGSITYTTHIAHVHRGEFREAVNPTCTSAGTAAHYACPCGMNFADEGCTQVLTTLVLPQKAHSFVAETAEARYLKSEANCKSAALYYRSCEFCGLTSKDTQQEATFSHGEKDEHNHVGDTYLSGKKAATCTENGFTGDTLCSGCQATLSSGTVIFGGHKLVTVAGIAATHEKDGVKAHYHCSVCQKYYADAAAAKEMTQAETVIPKQSHSYGDYLSDAEEHWKACSCGSITELDEHSFGSWKTVKKAQEKVKGLKERSCTVCGYTESKEIPAASSPATGDAMILLVLTVMTGSVLCAYLLLVNGSKGKYQR